MKEVSALIREHKKEILSLALDLRAHPEYGFVEKQSSSYIRSYWESIGLSVLGPYACTGLKAYIRGVEPGPCICLMGELDAVGCPNHPYADRKTGAAHACGHYIQSAQVFAAACALQSLTDQFAGSIALLEVPAEEFIRIEERMLLRKKGAITYLSGKPEMLKEGVFDDVDMAIMIHAHPNTPDYRIFLEGSNLGFAARNIRFLGKVAHGAMPFEGKNALQSATLFFAGVNANRETFRDEESIRIHPIITKGGTAVNCVPDDVRIETYVRGRTTEAIEKGCNVVDRCVDAAAEMIGCGYEIEKIPGYLPLSQNKAMSEVLAETAGSILGNDMVSYGVDSIGSSDVGDLSLLLPVIQPTMGGFRGSLHSEAFSPVDLETSCLLGGELLASYALKLLGNHAERARNVLDQFQPKMSKSQYFSYLDKGGKIHVDERKA